MLSGVSYLLTRTGTVRRASGIDTGADVESIFIPARTPVSVMISAPGYEDWYYPGVAEFSDSVPVFLQPAEDLSLDVKLRPLPRAR
jgi:hypothetical protein